MALLTPDTDPEAFMLHRLIQRLMYRQGRYQIREDYAIGNHPLPEGDRRYVQALKELQLKALTNYIGLANKAVVDGMSVMHFKFSGEYSEEAAEIWRANNMDFQTPIAIGKAAQLGDIYAMVSPPKEDDDEPRITIEDPRTCIVEPDPLDPMESVAGLKFYLDSLRGVTVAILDTGTEIIEYEGPTLTDFLQMETRYSPDNIVSSSGGFVEVRRYPNPVGKVLIVRGAWQPQWGLPGMAECEDGGFAIQDRINRVILDRLVIQKSQAYRQRWMTGAQIPKDRRGHPNKTPFNPGADMVWSVVDDKAKFGDFEEADIRQLLEAARDDIGDFAAVTQTPVSYLTNKMVNVSGETLAEARESLRMKRRVRKEAMGWFFERVIKLCFLYKGDTAKAKDTDATVVWTPENYSLVEIADFIAKASAAGLPPKVYLEKIGWTPQEIELAEEEMEKMQQQEHDLQIEMIKAQPAMAGGAGKPGAKSGASSPKSGTKASTNARGSSGKRSSGSSGSANRGVRK